MGSHLFYHGAKLLTVLVEDTTTVYTEQQKNKVLGRLRESYEGEIFFILVTSEGKAGVEKLINQIISLSRQYYADCSKYYKNSFDQIEKSSAKELKVRLMLKRAFFDEFQFDIKSAIRLDF
jgi:uncharacterized protein YdbL (DUF1318 family)